MRFLCKTAPSVFVASINWVGVFLFFKLYGVFFFLIFLLDQPGVVRRVPTPDSAVSGRADGMVPSGPLQGSFSRAFGLNAAVTEPWGVGVEEDGGRRRRMTSE